MNECRKSIPTLELLQESPILHFLTSLSNGDKINQSQAGKNGLLDLGFKWQDRFFLYKKSVKPGIVLIETVSSGDHHIVP